MIGLINNSPTPNKADTSIDAPRPNAIPIVVNVANNQIGRAHV